MPSLRITSMIAKVRMSKFVQNGIVIRNNQRARVRSERVAMKKAVGNPRTNASKVVASDSFTERQKIVRCASAKVTVSSKISLANSTRYQPSVEKSQITPPYGPLVRKE